ncbi:hypothetical protein OG585_43050 [Streptomyces sp. NBC_01340]|uniref:hypothetical protein n=1 Tax=unclassified Streptomyces TaxID=2593676 RepID=UPI002257DE94|nr:MULTISPECIES: hypothetical protein [unclassified Streptomyces]MCX4459511.1 hypothetical protein [Streptomyces sp. NBC_01719]MCX4498869.1 hypothetical protein [Streptomyces sp. NBC_01728]WSI43327.1 hypothetical protein OG585_43050 [Streptomyces sp. NBC_01340]
MNSGDRPVVSVMEVGGTHVSAASVDIESRGLRFGGAFREALDDNGSAADILSALVRCAAHLPVRSPNRWAVALPGPFDSERGIGQYEGVGKFDALRGFDNLTFTNPWPGKTMEYYADGIHKGTLSGTTIKLHTTVGETIDLAPAGTSLATIRSELARPATSYHPIVLHGLRSRTDPADLDRHRRRQRRRQLRRRRAALRSLRPPGSRTHRRNRPTPATPR